MKFGLYVALLVLQFADYVTTVYAIHRGARERNEVLECMFSRFGVELSVLIFKAVMIGVLAWQYDACPLWFFAAATAFYTYIIWRNCQVVLKIKRGMPTCPGPSSERY